MQSSVGPSGCQHSAVAHLPQFSGARLVKIPVFSGRKVQLMAIIEQVPSFCTSANPIHHTVSSHIPLLDKPVIEQSHRLRRRKREYRSQPRVCVFQQNTVGYRGSLD